MRKVLFWTAAVAWAFVLVAGVSGQSGGRFALVIGNSDYEGIANLTNPANDATDMAAALRRIGFEVDTLIDAELPEMEEAVVRLGRRMEASPSSLALFYYAGHGVQSGGENYLIPARTSIPSESFLRSKALSSQAVLDTLSRAEDGLTLVFLDACRDNPFGWSRGGNRGLSVVGVQPAGSIVMYATSAGSVALDGDGRNGTFTGELLKHIETPGLEIREVLNRTGDGVRRATNGAQIPAIYSQFFGAAHLTEPPVAAEEAPGTNGPREPQDTGSSAGASAASRNTASPPQTESAAPEPGFVTLPYHEGFEDRAAFLSLWSEEPNGSGGEFGQSTGTRFGGRRSYTIAATNANFTGYLNSYPTIKTRELIEVDADTTYRFSVNVYTDDIAVADCGVRFYNNRRANIGGYSNGVEPIERSDGWVEMDITLDPRHYSDSYAELRYVELWVALSLSYDAYEHHRIPDGTLTKIYIDELRFEEVR